MEGILFGHNHYFCLSGASGCINFTQVTFTLSAFLPLHPNNYLIAKIFQYYLCQMPADIKNLLNLWHPHSVNSKHSCWVKSQMFLIKSQLLSLQTSFSISFLWFFLDTADFYHRIIPWNTPVSQCKKEQCVCEARSCHAFTNTDSNQCRKWSSFLI